MGYSVQTLEQKVKSYCSSEYRTYGEIADHCIDYAASKIGGVVHVLVKDGELNEQIERNGELTYGHGSVTETEPTKETRGEEEETAEEETKKGYLTRDFRKSTRQQMADSNDTSIERILLHGGRDRGSCFVVNDDRLMVGDKGLGEVGLNKSKKQDKFMLDFSIWGLGDYAGTAVFPTAQVKSLLGILSKDWGTTRVTYSQGYGENGMGQSGISTRKQARYNGQTLELSVLLEEENKTEKMVMVPVLVIKYNNGRSTFRLRGKVYQGNEKGIDHRQYIVNGKFFVLAGGVIPGAMDEKLSARYAAVCAAYALLGSLDSGAIARDREEKHDNTNVGDLVGSLSVGTMQGVYSTVTGYDPYTGDLYGSTVLDFLLQMIEKDQRVGDYTIKTADHAFGLWMIEHKDGIKSLGDMIGSMSEYNLDSIVQEVTRRELSLDELRDIREGLQGYSQDKYDDLEKNRCEEDGTADQIVAGGLLQETTTTAVYELLGSRFGKFEEEISAC